MNTTETPKTTLEVLKAGLERIKRGWCKNTFARNARGLPVHSMDETACQWCAIGALPASGRYLAVESLFAANKGLPPASLNDLPDTTQADIIALYERAIAAEEAKGAKS